VSKLKLNKNFSPITIDEGDELFRNGIFEFNISKMILFIKNNPEDYIPLPVPVKDFVKDFSSINEDYKDSVTSTELFMLAEISPRRYNLIDGNHRMEKARRSGKEHIMAYRINAEHHKRRKAPMRERRLPTR
jgi:hypothetical protein